MFVRLSVLFACAVLAVPLAAQPSKSPNSAVAAPGPQPIARAAFIANMDAEFARMDANHDGKLTKQKIEAYLHAKAMQQIMARNRSIFDALDTNHDGALSREEFARFHAEPPPPNATPFLQKFDLNHDGVVTLVEYRTVTLANFDRLDTDKDGVVTPAEMKAGGITK